MFTWFVLYYLNLYYTIIYMNVPYETNILYIENVHRHIIQNRVEADATHKHFYS